VRIHHLNCGSLKPYWPRLEAIVYCLLVETNQGLLLVDTGFGLQDYERPTPIMRLFTRLLRVPRDEQETAVRQISRLGYSTEDVRHIVMTHLHLDHAGGLRDLTAAKVHVYGPELEAAKRRQGYLGMGHQPVQWAHGPNWVLHREVSESWFGFDAIPIAVDLEPRVLLVPLPGHSPGHCGVAIQTPEGWLLHCGDAASPFHPASDPHQPSPTSSSWLIRAIIGDHVSRLRALLQEHGDEVRLISGHDVHSLKRYQEH